MNVHKHEHLLTHGTVVHAICYVTVVGHLGYNVSFGQHIDGDQKCFQKLFSGMFFRVT